VGVRQRNRICPKKPNLSPPLKGGMALLGVLANFKVDVEFSISSFLQTEI